MNNKQIAWLFLIVITIIIGISASVLSFFEVLVLSVLLGGLGAIIYRKFFPSKVISCQILGQDEKHVILKESTETKKNNR